MVPPSLARTGRDSRRAPWRTVSRALGIRPLVSGDVGLRRPLRVERYLFQARRQRLPGLPVALLVVHLGGARVSGGRLHSRADVFVPSFALFLPAGCASEWTFEGAVDVAGFYLPDATGARLARAARRTGSAAGEYPFSDRLVTALTQQIVEELGRGPAADTGYLAELSQLVVRQLERALMGRAGQRMAPDWIQLGRLKQVIERIDRQLGGDLSNAVLARQAGVGESYFRRLFSKALGQSPNQYVQQRRLDRARDLLAETNLPIAHVAAECGFASQSYLTTRFRARHGITPARFRQALRLSANPRPRRHPVRPQGPAGNPALSAPPRARAR